jgi:hypothetical protein
MTKAITRKKDSRSCSMDRRLPWTSVGHIRRSRGFETVDRWQVCAKEVLDHISNTPALRDYLQFFPRSRPRCSSMAETSNLSSRDAQMKAMLLSEQRRHQCCALLHAVVDIRDNVGLAGQRQMAAQRLNKVLRIHVPTRKQSNVCGLSSGSTNKPTSICGTPYCALRLLSARQCVHPLGSSLTGCGILQPQRDLFPLRGGHRSVAIELSSRTQRRWVGKENGEVSV